MPSFRHRISRHKSPRRRAGGGTLAFIASALCVVAVTGIARADAVAGLPWETGAANPVVLAGLIAVFVAMVAFVVVMFRKALRDQAAFDQTND